MYTTRANSKQVLPSHQGRQHAMPQNHVTARRTLCRLFLCPIIVFITNHTIHCILSVWPVGPNADTSEHGQIRPWTMKQSTQSSHLTGVRLQSTKGTGCVPPSHITEIQDGIPSGLFHRGKTQFTSSNHSMLCLFTVKSLSFNT